MAARQTVGPKIVKAAGVTVPVCQAAGGAVVGQDVYGIDGTPTRLSPGYHAVEQWWRLTFGHYLMPTIHDWNASRKTIGRAPSVLPGECPLRHPA